MQEQRIGKIKSIGIYTVWKFPSYTTFFSKAEYCRTSSFGEHSLAVLLPSHKQRNAPLINVPLSLGGAASYREGNSLRLDDGRAKRFIQGK